MSPKAARRCNHLNWVYAHGPSVEGLAWPGSVLGLYEARYSASTPIQRLVPRAARRAGHSFPKLFSKATPVKIGRLLFRYAGALEHVYYCRGDSQPRDYGRAVGLHHVGEVLRLLRVHWMRASVWPLGDLAPFVLVLLTRAEDEIVMSLIDFRRYRGMKCPGKTRRRRKRGRRT